MYKDPRGPQRKIVATNNIETPCDQGILLSKTVTLDCGHTHTMNPIYTYFIGDRCRCHGCDKEGM